MSYDKEILNRIDQCFETQLDRIKEYKTEINSTYEKIIDAFENNDDVRIDKCYTNVYENDDRIELNVKVGIPITDSICSTIRSLFDTIDPNDIGINKNDLYSDLVKKNIEYGKKYLDAKFKEYFSKCNFEYTDSIIHIADRKILEMHFVRKEYYSNIV